MAFDTDNLAKAGFKKLFGKAHSGPPVGEGGTKDLPNESVASQTTVASTGVYGVAIPLTPPASSTASIRVCITGQEGELDLTEDGSSNGNTYFVTVPTAHDLLSFTNPETGSNYQVGERVQNIVTAAFGSGYRPIPKDNGTEVPPTDAVDWFLDDKAGTLTSETDMSLSTTGTIACYVYVGDMVSDVLTTQSDHGNLTGLGDDDHTQYVRHNLSTAANDFLVGSGSNTWIKKTLAETGAILEADIDHGNIQGLGDDDHTQYLLAAGTRALSADWDAGSFKITAEQFESDIITGTAPFIVASTTEVANLHAATASQWSTTRTIGMSGDVSSDAVNIDGSGNVTITNTVVANDSHTHSIYLNKDGSVALTANWDAGSFKITAESFESDITTGTAPFIVASTTSVTNLNADLLDGAHVGTSGAALGLLNAANTWSAAQTFSANPRVNDNIELEFGGSLDAQISWVAIQENFQIKINTEGGDFIWSTAATTTVNSGIYTFTTGGTSGAGIDTGGITFTTGTASGTGASDSGAINFSTGGSTNGTSGDINFTVGAGSTDGTINFVVDSLSKITILDTIITFNDGSGDVDLRMESATNSNMFRLDAAGEFITIGASTGLGKAFNVVGGVTLGDSASISPLNVTERSVEPSAPASEDIYLDDGTNTASGDPGWRRYTGAVWEDISAGAGGAGSPGGADTQIQYNNGGAFGGIADFTWDDTDILVGGTSNTTKIGFRSIGNYINSGTANILDLVGSTSVDISAGGGFRAFRVESGGVTIGSGQVAVDYTLNIDGETNDFLATWKEDEDYLQLSDDLFMVTTERIYFDSTAQYLYASDATTMNLNAATTLNLGIGGTTNVSFIQNAMTLGDGTGSSVAILTNTSASNLSLLWNGTLDHLQFNDDMFMAGTGKIKIGESDGTAFIQGNASDEILIQADVRVTIGVAGDIILGDSTERDMYPQTDLKVNLGLTANKFNDFKMGGITVWEPSTTTDITAAGGITVTNTIMRVQGSGGAIDITADPQIVAGEDGQIVIIEGKSDTNTVRLDDGNGLHLHGSAILSKDEAITLYYDSVSAEWEEISRSSPPTEKSWAFTSPSGTSGTFYYGGFYNFASSDNDFSPSTTHGTANSAYAAHFLAVLGATTVDTLTIRVTGTSINDSATRTTSDTEDIVFTHPASVDDYVETSKKWIGQVSVVVLSGTPKTCNYGFAKYWDNNNNDFIIEGLEATWLAGANDSAPNIILRHHKAIGWTFNAAAEPTPPTALASMGTDHSTEDQCVNGEEGAWKRDNLTTTVNGNDGEGTIIEIVTTSNKAFELGNFLLRSRHT